MCAFDSRSPGRARRKPLKPLRAGTLGVLGCLCGEYARVLYLFCTRGCGCSGTRRSPRPLSRAERFLQDSGATRRESAKPHLKLFGCLKSETRFCAGTIGWANRKRAHHLHMQPNYGWWARRERAFVHPTLVT
jgi:hypothetical protein